MEFTWYPAIGFNIDRPGTSNQCLASLRDTNLRKSHRIIYVSSLPTSFSTLQRCTRNWASH